MKDAAASEVNRIRSRHSQEEECLGVRRPLNDIERKPSVAEDRRPMGHEGCLKAAASRTPNSDRSHDGGGRAQERHGVTGASRHLNAAEPQRKRGYVVMA